MNPYSGRFRQPGGGHQYRPRPMYGQRPRFENFGQNVPFMNPNIPQTGRGNNAVPRYFSNSQTYRPRAVYNYTTAGNKVQKLLKPGQFASQEKNQKSVPNTNILNQFKLKENNGNKVTDNNSKPAVKTDTVTETGATTGSKESQQDSIKISDINETDSIKSSADSKAVRKEENSYSKEGKNAGSKGDENVDSKVDENVNSKTDEKADSKEDERANSKVDEIVDSKVKKADSKEDERANSKVDEIADSKVDEKADNKVDENVDSKVDEKADNKVAEKSSSNVDENSVDKDEDSGSDDETGYCKYCKKAFSSSPAYYAHTRGINHINLVIEAEEKKKHGKVEQTKIESNSEELPDKKVEANMNESSKWQSGWQLPATSQGGQFGTSSESDQTYQETEDHFTQREEHFDEQEYFNENKEYGDSFGYERNQYNSNRNYGGKYHKYYDYNVEKENSDFPQDGHKESDNYEQFFDEEGYENYGREENPPNKTDYSDNRRQKSSYSTLDNSASWQSSKSDSDIASRLGYEHDKTSTGSRYGQDFSKGLDNSNVEGHGQQYGTRVDSSGVGYGQQFDRWKSNSENWHGKKFGKGQERFGHGQNYDREQDISQSGHGWQSGRGQEHTDFGEKSSYEQDFSSSGQDQQFGREQDHSLSRLGHDFSRGSKHNFDKEQYVRGYSQSAGKGQDVSEHKQSFDRGQYDSKYQQSINRRQDASGYEQSFDGAQDNSAPGQFSQSWQDSFKDSSESRQFFCGKEREQNSNESGQFFGGRGSSQMLSNETDSRIDNLESESVKQSAEYEEPEEDDDDDDDDEDEDTSFCKYCKLSFSSAVAFHAHTRGMQHTTLVMEEKRKKGDERFKEERVAPEVLKVEIPKPKPVVENKNLEDCDTETNWMNLDEDIIKLSKSKEKASERDLTPDELGKKMFNDHFCCALCNVKCTSALTFKMHIDGKQHKTNLGALDSGNHRRVKQKKSVGSVFTDTADSVPSKFLSEIAAGYKEAAIVGLEYITEFQKPDLKSPCRYVCNLCVSKCDESTILPHVIGVKHRLRYLREEHSDIYEHLTKFTSKKKKSEMNASCEEFAKQIEDSNGRQDVKVRIELETVNKGQELNTTMARMSKALKEKMEEIMDLSDAESEVTAGHEVQNRTRKEQLGFPFEERDLPPRSGMRFHPLPPGRGGPPNVRGLTRGPHSFPQHLTRGRRFPPFPPPPPQRSRWEPPYYSSYYRREDYEYDMECRRIDDMMDRYRLTDPYLEVRRLEDLRERQRSLREFENKRLDELMARQRLQDPLLESTRLEDILRRKQKIEEMDRARLEDIMRRKRLLEENDVEKLRLERFEKLRKTQQEQDVSVVRDTDRPSMEELIARRRAKNPTSGFDNRPLADQSLLPRSSSTSVASSTVMSDHPAKVTSFQAATYPSSVSVPMSQPSAKLPSATHQPAPSTGSPKAVKQSTVSAAAAAEQVMANKEFQEELAKNPGVNIGELLANMSSSMIATEDDAAMALQISNTLTQALLKFRLQNATKQLKKMDTASKQSEPKSIPGLGNSESVSGKSVPSFLRTVENQPVTKPPLTNANTFVKKIRELPPSTSSTDKPERDLLKSIREQAQKLQEQLTSGVDNTHSGTQPGIQSQSQFVHGQSTFSAYSHS